MPKKLTEASVKKALADGAAGLSYDVTDAGAAGLILRAAPRGSSWLVRFMWGGSFKRLRLGPVDLVSLTVAREIAAAARTLIREQDICPTEAWVHDQLVRRRVLAKPEPEHVSPPKPTTWTYSEAVEHYLTEVKRTRRERTWSDRRDMLNIVEMRPLRDRPVGSIARREIATVVAEIHRSGRERHAAHLCEAVRPLWTWLAGDAQQLRSGVLSTDMAQLRAPEKTNREGVDDGGYVPPPAEIGRILKIAQAGVVDEVLADALLLMLFTAQRRRSVVNARLTDFIEEPDGSLTWAIAPIHRKTGRGKKRTHDLPLPSTPAAMVRRRIAAVAADEESESPWLFPATRPRRAGDEVSHVHADSLTHLLDALPGSDAAPHDIRRGFTTHLEDLLGLDASELKLVLDHSEGKSGDDVTEKHYSRARRLARKAAMLEPWAALIEKHAAALALGDLDALRDGITAGRKRQKTKKGTKAAA
ncbi:integrase family protein [Bosea robiniae]|uniref:Phage integrase family protein n=1 Tax=Bosea robiniae TaxID=1036780 RepID=A0ABY0P4G1_9HYPH|nr:integrase family protein [Bosea robiniae]SDH19872.1 Phage integrase family protein [Bosea robiniae]